MNSTTENSHVLVYVDNSNIFINAIHHSAQRKNFLPKIQDPLVRVNEKKLIELATKNRHIIAKKSYGKLPSTSLIETKEKSGTIVYECKSSGFNCREKEADTKLTADAVEDILTYNYEHQNVGENVEKAIILFSGDKDMLPLIKKARKHGWNVEVWTFKNARSNAILKEQQDKAAGNSTSMSIHLLDKYFHLFTFYEYEWRDEIPAPRTFVASIPVKYLERPLQNSIADLVSKELKVPIAIKVKVGSKQYEDFTLIYFVIAAPTKRIGENETLAYNYNIDNMISKFQSLQNKLLVHLGKRVKFNNSNQPIIEIKTMPDFKNYTKEDYIEEDNGILDVTFHNNKYNILPIDVEVNPNDNSLPLNEIFIDVERKTKRPKHVKCKAGPRCLFGSKCNKSHSPEEKKLFYRNENETIYPSQKRMNRSLYKTIYCNRGQSCKYINEKSQCYFAHSESEIYCLECKACVKHKTEFHTPQFQP